MRILIVGGCGSIGSHLAERFIKEGNDIFVIDNLSNGKKEKITSKYSLYELDTANRQCEEVFRLYNIDIVIYAVGGKSGNCNGLMNILALAVQYEVKKFLFLSSVKAGSSIAEECCHLYAKQSGTEIIVARLSELYGPERVDGIVAAYIRGALLNKEVIIEKNQADDFIYIEDAVDAVFRLAERGYQGGFINISSNTSSDRANICDCLEAYVAFERIDRSENIEGNVVDASVDNSDCVEELGWRSKYTLKTGLAKTCLWYKEQLAADARNKECKKSKGFVAWRPYLENALFFLVMVAITVNRHYQVTNDIGMDYNFIYIAAMGLLYGKSQALPAVCLSSVLLMTGFIAKGADFVAILYQAQHMVHFASYLFFGVLVGYITDNKDRAYHDLHVELKNAKDRFHFLEGAYIENIAIKERLYKQIVNSDDSIGRTYKIVKKLDAIEVENVFTEATEVAAEMMAASNASIYVLNRQRNYLRLKTTIGMQLGEIPKSIKVGDHDYLKELMQDKQVFVNKLLVPGLPDMAAPVLYNDEVIAVIQIYRLKFEELSLNKQNLLKITALLIASALAKAYQYEESVQATKYIADTRILVPEEFRKIEEQIEYRKANNENEEFAILLKMDTLGQDYVTINDILSPLIRDEDFLGIKDDHCVYLLLVNISGTVVTKVQRRIQDAGLMAEVVMNHGIGA